MAGKKTTSKTTPKQDVDIVDAVVVEVNVEDVELVEPTKADETKEDTPELEALDEGSQTSTDLDPVPESSEKKSSGFGAMVLGGVVAGGIGFSAAYMLPYLTNTPDPIAPLAQAQGEVRAELEALSTNVAALPDQSGAISTLNKRIDGIATQISILQSESDAGLSALINRMDALEKQPLSGSVSPQAIAAYERELNVLREAINVQRTQIEKVAADAAAQIEAAKAEAQAMEQNAEAVSQSGIARAAVGRVQAALDTGAVYAAALGDLRAVMNTEIPTVLAENASTGIASLIELQDEFPEAARAALKVARQAGGPAEGEGAVASFFKSQLGVRSLTPQEGNSADAVLSRAEGAVAAGRLNDALAELSTLSDAGQVPLAAWVALAEIRLNAVSAAQDLADTLTDN